MILNAAVARKMLATGHEVLKPDRSEEDWWAGAPSVTRDASGTLRCGSIRIRDVLGGQYAYGKRRETTASSTGEATRDPPAPRANRR